ncbi:hypothetical protein PC129_g5420 [Phytophthora cactorum]|uniref:Uncharacterized protein n=1 Tax=Phytophthora cactorum TaxID=29920 RepID=A0A329SS22_9STRA|nr:hypothetical protein Pcac1_g14866 [Phytophthora cactorum]KAG2832972.1 hypothetical protein PC112_g6683 [Phytophthora cactorum]KAG2835379.1 hypothetical protein PC111_g5454 [Phytophthora cactorum]KAG2860898.1 hypothetical protein PC113_g7668 [Phytophthora cactorum]KAG2902087.1 hypothetical protein PC115_g15704 [Phytophthora cactorum]
MSKHANWDSDGVDGGPSSIDVLLEWLATPGSVEKWLVSAGRKNFVAEEIYVYFLSRGIPHRNRNSITSKLWHFVHQFGEAEEWLKRKGCSHFDVNCKVRRKVLQICPYYCELAPLLRPSWMVRTTRSHTTTLGRNVEIESSDDEFSAVEGRDSAHLPTESERGSRETRTVNPQWDSDAKNGRPSSLDVVLEWLSIPGNARRWSKSSVMRDGSRHKLSAEVYELLLSHDISYRSIKSIKTKLGELNRQLVQAEKWLETRGIRRYSVSVNEKTEREVLRICPHYTKIASLFQSSASRTHGSEAQTTHTTEDSEDQSSDDDSSYFREKVTKASPKRARSEFQTPKAKCKTVKWDSDSIDGGPTSMALLLEWLGSPGNAKRWQKSAGTQGEVRLEMVEDIYQVFVSHGIKHRTIRSIESKLGHLVQQFEEAEKWLKIKGLRHCDTSTNTERAVLRICPNYREIAPLLRCRAPHIASSNTAATVAASEPIYQSSDDEIEDGGDEDLTNSKWDSDGVNGRPSSLNLLLKWIVTPGNAARWQEAARKADGSRLVLAAEIYDLLLTYGITYRTVRGAESKLRALEDQFDKAESWLVSKGIQNTTEVESVVLQLCPVYRKIEPPLRSAQRTAVSPTSCNREIDIRFRPTVQNLAARLSGSKRGRNEHTQQTSAQEMLPVVALEAEPEERRELLKLELQIKRDEAVLVRAKVRKEVLEMGLPRNDVDRLLPL